MESHNIREARPNSHGPRMVKCGYCRDRIPLVEALRGRGICRLCRQEVAEMSWRTIYDRDLQIGEIPINLREAYGL